MRSQYKVLQEKYNIIKEEEDPDLIAGVEAAEHLYNLNTIAKSIIIAIKHIPGYIFTDTAAAFYLQHPEKLIPFYLKLYDVYVMTWPNVEKLINSATNDIYMHMKGEKIDKEIIKNILRQYIVVKNGQVRYGDGPYSY